MGICQSKCFPSPTASMSDPESPRQPREIDKLILSSLTLTTPPPSNSPFSDNPKNFSKFQINPSPPSSPPSSSSNPSTTLITSNSNTSSTSYSYSSKFQTPKKKTFSDEFLLSVAKENANKAINEKEKEKIRSQITIPPPEYRPIMTRTGLTSSSSSSSLSTLRHRSNLNFNLNSNTSNKNVESIQAKRARSVSPASRNGRKTIRSETGPIRPVNPISSSMTTKPRIGAPPLPQRKLISSQKGKVNVIMRDLKVPTMEKEMSLSEDTMMREIDEEEGEEVVSRERVRTPPPLVEDLNNPLIAMDCFIFL